MAFDVKNVGNNIFHFERKYKGFVDLGGCSGPLACGWWTEHNIYEELHKFQEEHPELIIINITQQTNKKGETTAYIVICKERKCSCGKDK